MSTEVGPSNTKTSPVSSLPGGVSETTEPNPTIARPQPNEGGRFGKWIFLIGGLAALLGVGYLLTTFGETKEAIPEFTHTITQGDLVVSISEQGTLESFNNTEVKCRVRGFSTVTYVVKTGTIVQPGDELVRLDTKTIDDSIGTQETAVHEARATYEKTKADVATSEISIEAYLEGTYKSQLQTLEREVEIARTNLETAEQMYAQSEVLFKRGYVTDLEVEGNKFTVTQAELELRVKERELEVLNKYTKAMELERLNGDLIANRSKLERTKPDCGWMSYACKEPKRS